MPAASDGTRTRISTYAMVFCHFQLPTAGFREPLLCLWKNCYLNSGVRSVFAALMGVNLPLLLSRYGECLGE